MAYHLNNITCSNQIEIIDKNPYQISESLSKNVLSIKNFFVWSMLFLLFFKKKRNKKRNSLHLGIFLSIAKYN